MVNVNHYGQIYFKTMIKFVIDNSVQFETILNDTSNVIDSVFAIFQPRLEQLNLTFHHRFRTL